MPVDINLFFRSKFEFYLIRVNIHGGNVNLKCTFSIFIINDIHADFVAYCEVFIITIENIELYRLAFTNTLEVRFSFLDNQILETMIKIEEERIPLPIKSKPISRSIKVGFNCKVVNWSCRT